MINYYIKLVPLAVLLTAAYLALVPAPASADANVLWNIVNKACVPSQKLHGSPAPCSVVSSNGRYAILKDIRGNYQYLLIPTDRITGIEDPVLLQNTRLNYFSDAWNERNWMAIKTHMSILRQDVSLAINSKYARSQNQLHIHIDCVRPDVAAFLAAHERQIGTTWSVAALPPAGHKYQIRRIRAADLRNENPFLLVADQSPQVRSHMAGETIVVIGSQFASGEQGFFLLSDKFDPAGSDPAAGVELQDQSCALVHPK